MYVLACVRACVRSLVCLLTFISSLSSVTMVCLVGRAGIIIGHISFVHDLSWLSNIARTHACPLRNYIIPMIRLSGTRNHEAAGFVVSGAQAIAKLGIMRFLNTCRYAFLLLSHDPGA